MLLCFFFRSVTLSSSPFCEVCLGEVGQLVVGNGLLGQFRIVGAEDEYALFAKEESIDVGKADASLAEQFHHVCSTARSVVKLQGKHIRQGNGNASLAQLFASTHRFSTDDAQDSILGRIGNGGRYELDIGFLQQLQHIELDLALY